MDDINIFCFQLSRSQGIPDLESGRGNYDTMLIDRSCIVKSTFYGNSNINLDTPRWCTFI